MEVIIFIIVIAAFLAIASGIWVAIALIDAILTQRDMANTENGNDKYHIK